MISVAAVATVLAGLGCAVLASAASKRAGNRDVVSNTVYDGEFSVSQNAWSALPVQFSVTARDEVNHIAPAAAFCAPPGQLTLAKAKIRDDAFSSKTSEPGNFHVTISGRFEAHEGAKGTGLLRAETILGQECTERGHWTGKALPTGTKLCPHVDTGLVVETTVTHMTCSKAGLAYAAGLRQLSHEGPNAPFESPGYMCKTPDHDSVVRTVCTRGGEVFRLP